MKHVLLCSTLSVGLSAYAQTLTLDFGTHTGNLGSTTHTFTVQADGSSFQNAGGTNYDTVGEGLTGDLTGATGSFSFTAQAIQDFDSGDFSFENFATRETGNEWLWDGNFMGISSSAPVNNGIQVSGVTTDATAAAGFVSEAILFTFDLSNLSIADGYALQFDGLFLQNTSPGALRISYLEDGSSSPLQLTGNDDEPNAVISGSDVFQDAPQIIDTNDQIALWASSNSGQKRFGGYQFSIVAVPEPSTVALLFGGASVLLVGLRRRFSKKA
ncbi:MAG: PEP-CTERM sorting domain-containing protein [Opitutales bacterium]